MATYGTTTDPAELFGLIEARVESFAGFAAAQVFWTLLPDAELVKTPRGKTFVTIRPGRMLPILPQATGGGVASFDARLQVSLWHKLDTDQQSRAGGTLLDPTRGVMPQWLKVLGSLHLFSPTRTAGGANLTIEPIRLAGDGLDLAPRVPQEWCRLDSTWQVKFVHRLA